MPRLLENGKDALAGLVFALLVLAVFAHVWFASTPLPLGGLNIWLAVAATLFAVVLALWRVAPRVCTAGWRQTIAAAFRGPSRHATLALLAALAMWAWVHVVYLRTGTFDAMRAGQLTVGVGVLFASLCVHTAWRARGLIAAIVIATALSALFGIGVLVVGNPFVDVWLHIARVAESDLDDVLTFGRTAGAAIHPATLGYQLAVAIVLGFAMLVFGAPARGVAPDRRARRVDAAWFLLLAFMLAALVVNASRSSTLGVAVGVGLCVVGVAVAPAPRRGVVRLLVLGPLAVLPLLLSSNPWLDLGDLAEELRKKRLDTGDVHDLALAAGGEALATDAPHVFGHRLEGYEPGVEYKVGLRTRYTKGYGSPNIVKTKADANGSIVITWCADPHRVVAAYQYRSAEVVEARYKRSWRPILPTLRSRGVKLAVSELAVGGAALTRGDPDIVGAELTGLAPGQAYELQMRNVAGGPTSHARGQADEDGRLVLTWRRIVLPQHYYRCRARRSPDEAWSRWLDCAPSLPRPPVWRGLRQGRRTLTSGPDGAERIGHEFAGPRPWKWYRVQIEEKLAAGVARAPRYGEVVAWPRLTGYFAITWPAPPVPEGVAGYRFRMGDVEADWLPWRDFVPSLSSRAPMPVPMPAGGSVAGDDTLIWHLLLGLPAGTEQRVQLRVRTERGFGRASVPINGVVGKDGGLVLAWRLPPGARVEAAQFRRRTLYDHWLLWQDLTPPLDGGHTAVDLNAPGRAGREVVTTAHLMQEVGAALPPRRLLNASDLSAQGRLPQTVTAVRYALDHPFGTGVYRPTRAHAGEGLSEIVVEETLRSWPHNQFLHVLVLYGLPGLCLHLAFYGFLAWAAWRAAKLAWREPREELRFLVVAVVAAWASYSVNSLLNPTGPFLEDWGHFFLLGLLLSLEGILAEDRS